MTSHFCLYRLYDKSNILLYIGKTVRGAYRIAEHQDKPWFSQISFAKIESFENETALNTAEKESIKAENPKYNVEYSIEKAIRIKKTKPKTYTVPQIAWTFRLPKAEEVKELDELIHAMKILDKFRTRYSSATVACYKHTGKIMEGEEIIS